MEERRKKKTLVVPFFMIGAIGIVHVVPGNTYTPCEPSIISKIHTAIVPSAKASCRGYCQIMECSFGGEWCGSSCYDGSSYTFCVEPIENQAPR